MEDLLSGFKSLLATQLTQVTETIQTKLNETDRRVEEAKLDLGTFKKEFELTRNEVKDLKEVMLEIRGYLGGIDTMRRLPEEPIREEKVEEKKEKEIEKNPSEEKVSTTNDDELKGVTTEGEPSSSSPTLPAPKQENSSYSLNGVPTYTVSTSLSDSQTPTESEDSRTTTSTSPPSFPSSDSSSDSSSTSASEASSTANSPTPSSSQATFETSTQEPLIASTSSQTESPDQESSPANPPSSKSKSIIGQSKFNPRTHLNFKVTLDPDIDEKVMDCIKEVLVDRKEPFYLWPFVDGEVPGGCFEEFASLSWSNIKFSELPNSEEKMKSSTWPVYLKREENSIFLTFVERFQWEHDRWDIKRYYIGKMDPKSNFESIRVIAFNMKDPEQSLRVTLSLEE